MDPIKKAEKLLKVLESYGSITKEEQLAFMQDVVNVLSQFKSATATINQETKDTFALIVKRVSDEHVRILSEVDDKTEKGISDVKSEYENAIKQARILIEDLQSIEMKDGENGKDGIDGTPGRDGKDGKDGSRDTGEEIIDKVNSSKGKIKKERVEGLEQAILNSAANAAASLPATTTFVNGQRAKNLNFIGATVTQTGDTANVTVSSSSSNAFGTFSVSGQSDVVADQASDTLTLVAGTNMTITTNAVTDTITLSAASATSGIVRSISSVAVDTAAGSAAATDYVYLVTGTTTITLPTASSNTNLYTIKRVGTGVVTVTTTSAQTIDASSTAAINVRYQSLSFVSDGSNWNVV